MYICTSNSTIYNKACSEDNDYGGMESPSGAHSQLYSKHHVSASYSQVHIFIVNIIYISIYIKNIFERTACSRFLSNLRENWKSLSGIVFRSNKSLQKYFSCFEAALCGMQVIFEGIDVIFLILTMEVWHWDVIKQFSLEYQLIDFKSQLDRQGR